jgi:AcrR family transcriptional regulator
MPFRVLDEDEQDQLAIIEASLATIYHFFGGPSELFRAVQDPRVSELITYLWEVLGFVGILMFLCHLGARRQIALMFRGNGSVAAKLRVLFGVKTCPHGDTLNEAASRLDPDQMQEAVTDMTRTLIRKKVLYRYRLLDRYFVVAIDGTGRLTFPERHCPNCLTAKHHGKTIYYHPV